MRWLIPNRNLEQSRFGTEQAGLTYLTLKLPDLPLDVLTSRQAQRADTFRKILIQTANRFPNSFGLAPEKQKHVCFFIHGDNAAWTWNTYGDVAIRLFDGPDSLREIVSSDWPSKRSLLGYLSDRAEARKTGVAVVIRSVHKGRSPSQLGTSCCHK